MGNKESRKMLASSLPISICRVLKSTCRVFLGVVKW